MIEVFADGCSLGNPGPAGAGAVIYKNKKVIKEISEFIGETTNNVAEYSALILALFQLINIPGKEIKIYLDSELVVRQIQGIYKIKNKKIFTLSLLAKELISQLGRCSLTHIPRTKNQRADSLAKKGANKKPVGIKFTS